MQDYFITKSNIIMSIFKAYDIRGIYGKELTNEIAEKIAKAFVNLLHSKNTVVGMDVRTSSPELKRSVIKGLISQNCNVIDIGLVPIPLFYYLIVRYKMKAGIYVSGSHDPSGYNGLKLCRERSIDLTYESGIEKIEKLYSKNYPNKKTGRVIKKDISDEYKKQLLKKFKIKKPLHVVVDAGNGVWSKLAPEIFEDLNFKVTKLFCEFDGTFPNRHPEPTENSLEKLRERVREVRADFGVAYDADGDRAVFIDENGRFIHPDFILMLFARKLLKKNNTLIADIRCTGELEKEAKKYKWKLIWNRVGRSYIKQKMIKLKATLGGEYSGHYYFKENDYFDDGLFTSLLFARILDDENKAVSSLINEFPHHPSIDFRIHCIDEKKFRVINKLKGMFKGYKLVLIDGIRINFNNGFVLVRASNTESKIELRCEAYTNSDLEKIKKDIEEKIRIAVKQV
jgi:phosphomannomutase/phosphoglucomutase